MIIHSTEHTFFYIDPNIKKTAGSIGGDGSSVANAAMDFPSEFQDNVIYLIRRTDNGYFARLPLRTTTSNVTSLVILGMPKHGTKYWDEMPEDAKTAWLDADVDSDYACICKYADNDERFHYTGWDVTNCRNFTMRNITLMNYATRDWEEKGWSIVCNSGYGCNGDIQHCRFGDAHILAEGSELGNTSELWDFETAGTDYNPQYCHGGRFIHLGDTCGNICTIKDIYIDNWSSRNAIYCGKKRNIIIEDIHFRTRSESARESGISWGSDEWISPTVRVKNCDYKFYYNNRHDRYMQQFISGRVERIYVDGITAGLGTTQSFDQYDNQVGIQAILGISSRFPGSSIKNVTCNFPDFHGGSGHLISFDYIHNNDSLYTAPQDQYIEIKDITINMCQTKDARYGNYNHDDSGANNFISRNAGLLYLARSGYYDHNVSSDFLVQNLTLNGLRSNVFYACSAILDLQDTDIVGNVALFNCVGKIKSISSWYPGYLLRDDGSNLLYIGKLNANLTNASYPYNKQESVYLSDPNRPGATDVSGHSHILVNEVTGNCWTSSYWDAVYPHSYVCTNDGMPGNYTCRTGRSKCQTWSAYNDQTDTGCSLKLINESGDDWHWPLRIGGDPFKGITKSVQAGSYNAEFFLALYGYNANGTSGSYEEIKDRLFIRIKLPNGNYVYSSAGKCVVDEDTVWYNIESTTNYKFVIPLDIATAGDIEIDYTWSFYHNGGITLLDPYPKITPRS